MRLRSILSGFIVLSILATSCTKDGKDDTQDGGGSALIFLDNSNFYRYSEASELQVYVKTDPGASYEVIVPSGASSWLSTTTKTSNEEGFVTFSLTENTTGKERFASVDFQYGKNHKKVLKISQDPKHRQDYFSEWGMEGTLEKYVTTERPYTWYIDQGDTGQYSLSNCGPTSAVMVARWLDGENRVTPKDARSEYSPAGGWWYVSSDFIPYLNEHKYPYHVIQFSSVDALLAELDKGKIAITCLDMNIVSQSKAENNRFGLFYPTSPQWGHFMVIKGYVKTDSKVYLEVNDPYTIGKKNLDGTPKGEGRYYDASEVQRSAFGWERRLFIFEKK
ncbi:MAG: C39 family peptidase [Bacteroidales bacterium]|nr:C39 family peptidase [Bacteroidales bacterium]